jgi:non-ribosomal peptide synthetase component F
MLSDREREQLLTDWNQNRAEPLPVTSLGELFDMQAARTPDLLAITCAG